MKYTVRTALVGLTMTIFTGCGGMPLAQPEGNASPAGTPVEEATKAVIIVQPQSPLTPPTPAKEPTPISATTDTPPAVVAISDEPLLSTEQLSAMGVKENESVSVVAWPTENELVLQVGNQPDAPTWTITRDTGAVQRAPNWQAQEDTLEQAAVAELQKYNEAVNFAVVSPDEQWAAWAAWETLLVKRLGTDEPPIDLLGVEYERFEGGTNTLVWSPDSKNIAYVVKNDNAGHYEIRISDPLSKNTIVLPLWNTSPSPIMWSPDGQYLAFKSLDQPQSGINHIYLFWLDRDELTQLTQHGLAKNPMHWSPTSTAIVYSHGKGDGSIPWLVTFKTR